MNNESYFSLSQSPVGLRGIISVPCLKCFEILFVCLYNFFYDLELTNLPVKHVTSYNRNVY